MPKLKELNIILPGLVWPEVADYDYLASQIKANHFGRLLGLANTIPIPFKYSDFIYSPEIDKALPGKYHEDNLAHGFADKLALQGFDSYLLVEPTHLRADRDRLLIAEADLLQLNPDEAMEIITIINNHFTGQLTIHYLTPHLWLMGLNIELPDLVSYPIIDIVGENIDEYLPSGQNSLELHKLLNEIQMLLHDLELNQIRKSDGLLAVNSIWLWDKQIPKLPFAIKKCLSSNQAWGMPINNLTEQLTDEIDTILIDQLYFPCSYQDSHAWLYNLQQLDTQLAKPLLIMLKQHKFKQLNLWLPGLNSSWCFSIKPLARWKFWRQNNLVAILKKLAKEYS